MGDALAPVASRELARCDAGLACSTIAALAELSSAKQRREPLIESVHHYNVARQFWDDVCDWLVLTESGKHLRLSPTAFHLARCLKEGRTAEELAAEMSKKGGAPVVDLGDIYFQSAVGAVFFAAFLLSGWDPLRSPVMLRRTTGGFFALVTGNANAMASAASFMDAKLTAEPIAARCARLTASPTAAAVERTSRSMHPRA